MGKVVVLGSINQDIVSMVDRHPSIGETVVGHSLFHLPGGKGANEAVAVARAGVDSLLIGALGNDAAGRELKLFLNDAGVDVSFVRTVENTTGTAIINVDEKGENTIVVVAAANDCVVDDDSVELFAGDVLLSQFEVPMTSILSFFERGRAAGCRTVLNPSPAKEVPEELLALVDVLVVNEIELAGLAGSASAADAAERLMPVGALVVTLGDAGAIAVHDDSVTQVKGIPVDVVDTTGAGDCFVGSLAAELALGVDFREAINYANSAAARCVTKQGAGPSMPYRIEIQPASSRPIEARGWAPT